MNPAPRTLDGALSYLGDQARASAGDPPPLTQIRRRAAALRRRRRAGGLFASAAVIATGAVAASIFLPMPFQGGAPLAQQAQAGDNCREVVAGMGGETRAVKPAQLGSLLQLPAQPDGFEPYEAYARRDSPVCPLPDPLLVAYDVAAGSGKAHAGMTVWINKEDAYLEASDTGTTAATTTKVTARGNEATLLTFDGGESHRLSWRDAKRKAWLVEAAGMSGKELLSQVNSLAISGELTQQARIDPASLPHGMKAAPMPQRDKPTGMWLLINFARPGTVKGNSSESDPILSLDVAGAREPVEQTLSVHAAPGRRLVSYEGNRYLADTVAPGRKITWVKDGKSFSLWAPKGLMSEAEQLRFAASLTPADPTDPGLMAAIDRVEHPEPVKPEDMREAGPPLDQEG